MKRLLFLLIAALVLTACGGDDEGEAPDTPATTAPSTNPTLPATSNASNSVPVPAVAEPVDPAIAELAISSLYAGDLGTAAEQFCPQQNLSEADMLITPDQPGDREIYCEQDDQLMLCTYTLTSEGVATEIVVSVPIVGGQLCGAITQVQ